MTEWIKAHGFECIVVNEAEEHIVWRTAIQTAEYKNGHLTWHNLEYFEQFKTEA